MVVSFPSGAESTLVAHGSAPELLLTDALVGEEITADVADVGKGNGVSVGKGVCVGGSVGGSGVAVGMDACVSATMVNAAATAVFCTSIACMVGAAGAPHALISIAISTTVKVEERFIFCDYLLMNLAIGVTTAECGNAVVFYSDFPIAFCDIEAAECFKILFTRNECSRAVLPNRSGEGVAGDDQVSTLTQGCHYIHGQNNRSFRIGLVGNGEIRGGSLPGSKRLIANILIVCVCILRSIW
jgi:hypothetical protein